MQTFLITVKSIDDAQATYKIHNPLVVYDPIIIGNDSTKIGEGLTIMTVSATKKQVKEDPNVFFYESSVPLMCNSETVDSELTSDEEEEIIHV